MGYNRDDKERRGDSRGPYTGRVFRKGASEVEGDGRHPQGAPHPPPVAPASTGSGRPSCPFCRSTDTELISLFGQQLLTVQYYCNACHTPFECVKDDDILDDYAARKEGQL